MFDPKIAISGAASGTPSEEGKEFAHQVGREIAARGGIVITGATTGIPLEAAKGAKSMHGTVIGFSPANSWKEHVNTYKLPTQYHDYIFFTGLDYAGRDNLLIDLADAVVELSGRLGTLHEFTQAFERNKIVGVLSNSGGTVDLLPEILQTAERGSRRVFFENTPSTLIKTLFREISEQNHK